MVAVAVVEDMMVLVARCEYGIAQERRRGEIKRTREKDGRFGGDV